MAWSLKWARRTPNPREFEDGAGLTKKRYHYVWAFFICNLFEANLSGRTDKRGITQSSNSIWVSNAA